LRPDDIVLVVDDVLATGGTLWAAIELVRNCGAQSIYAGVLIELLSLKGREKVLPINIFSAIQFD
jgi:adenine phosphoribosyltransferase